MKNPLKYVRKFIVLAILLTMGWLYFTSNKEQSEADNAYKALEKKLSDTLKDYNEFIVFANSMINDAAVKAAQDREAAKQSQTALDKERSRIKTLLTLLDGAEKEIPDSTWVQVSPDYKWGCDSLRNVVKDQDGLIAKYEQDNQAHVDALNYETYLRDSALQKEREFSNAFRHQLVYCIDALSKAQKATKKAQLYAGMAAWGNSLNPLGGGEINLGLKTGSDQFYEIKGAYLGKWWVGIGTKFKLSF